MPRGDGTGPGGFGPMTGRAAGFCAGYPVPGYMNPIGGRGFWGAGRGFGGRGAGRYGGGYGRYAGSYGPYGAGYAAYAPPGAPYMGYGPYPPPPAPEQELDMLKEESEHLEQALSGIRKRIEELGAEAGGK